MKPIITAIAIVFILVGITYEKPKVKAEGSSNWHIRFYTIPKEGSEILPVAQRRKSGKASWYGFESCTNPKCLQANGKPLSQGDDGMACSSAFRLGERVRLYYHGKSIVLTCSDTGGFGIYNRLFDLHKWNFERLEVLSRGVITVEWEKL